jgi:hypothetical protein
MGNPDPEESRVEVIAAATIYLMSHYMRSGCPQLALCVSRHLQCLALHPDAPPVLRDICAGLHGSWSEAAQGADRPQRAPLH